MFLLERRCAVDSYYYKRKQKSSRRRKGHCDSTLSISEPAEDPHCIAELIDELSRGS